MEVTPCSSCKAPVLFLQTRNGKWMPVDDAVADDGNVRISSGKAEVLAGLELEAARLDGEDLHLSHFATCPAAESFRR